MAALTVGAFVVRLARLLESPEPPGTDGYYYVVQMEHWLAEGRLHAPDASWVLRVLGLGSAVFGGPVVGVKVVSSVLAAVCVPAAWFAGGVLDGESGARDTLTPALSRRERGYSRALGWAAWAAVSPTLTHLSGDFPKTLGIVAPLFLVLGWAVSGRRGWGTFLGGMGAMLLAATAHRLGASLLGLGALGAVLGLVLRGRADSPERKWPLVLLGLGGLAVFALLTTVLPNLLHPKDLERVSSQLTLSPGWPPPFPYFSLRSTHWLQRVELGASWLGLACGAVLLWRRRPSRPLVMGLVLPLAVCLFPLWRGDVLDMGYRTSLLAPLLAVPLVLLAVPTPRPGLLPRPWIAPLVALALVPLARFGFDPQATPPYGRYRALISRLPQPLPELLIAHQGVNFLYGHVTGHDAMAWAPEPGLDRTRIGRLVWGVLDGEWMAYAPDREGLPPPVRLDRDYVYVREDFFEAFLARVREEGDEELLERLVDWHNPSAVRPASLLRNRD